MYRKLFFLITLIVVLGAAAPSVYGKTTLLIQSMVEPVMIAALGKPVAQWKFDGNYEDSSGNGHNGTPQGGPTFGEGIYGQALQLTGSPQYVDCGPGVSFATVGDGGTAEGLTVCFWVNRTAGGDQKIFSDTDNTSWGAAGGIKAAIYNNRLEPDIRDSRGRFWARDTTQMAMELNVWYHIVIVLDDVADTYTEYIDGQVIREFTNITQSVAASTVNFYIGRDTPRDTGYVNGLLDDMRLYDYALGQEEIDLVLSGVEYTPKSSTPRPKDKAIDVPREVTLSWEPGENAQAHDVYVGVVFEDVDSAGPDSPLQVAQNQEANTVELGRLEFGQTYYWRVDDISAGEVTRGNIWSFTVESVANPVPAEMITATASSQVEGQGPENTVNGSGLDESGVLHSSETEGNMWLSEAGDPGSAWIQFEFDDVCKLHEMLVWNYNGQSILAGYGLKEVAVEYSVDGSNWTPLESVSEFAGASGAEDYAYNTTVDLGDVVVKYVKITSNGNQAGGGFLNQYGLSEVRFLAIPVSARIPNPADGAADVALNVTLGWRAGREAAEHNVYLSENAQAVIDGTAPLMTVSQTEYSPLSLNLGGTYYWRVDEVNNVESHAIWQGDLWSFSVQEYLVVDDFESYNDIEAGQEGSNLVYLTWIDGFDNPSTNGSTIGYTAGGSMENAIVHGGVQSVPIMYDNTTASFSEVTVDPANLAIGRDWDNGAESLVLWAYGDPNNAVTERMYIKVNSVKHIMSNINLAQASWQSESIDLTTLGANLSNVSLLTIGFERTGAASGSGIVIVDDIQLYSPRNE